MIRRYLYNTAKNNLIRKGFRFSTKNTNEPQSSTQNINQQKKKLNEDKEDEADSQIPLQNRNTLGWTIWRIFVWGSIGLFSYNYYIVANNNSKQQPQNLTGAVPGFIQAAKFSYNSYQSFMAFLTQPPVKKFLPDPLHPIMWPKTLILNLSGTMIDTNFVFGKGMQLNKRPGLNQFLNDLSQLYEIVIFSDDQYTFIQRSSQFLDPTRQILRGYFGKQCMIWYKGKYIKDLKYLNRDLRKIIVIDKSKDSVAKHPQNVIVLSQYHGSQQDRQLLKLLPLLRKMAGEDVKDVRKTIQKLGQNPVDTYYNSFKQKQQKIKQKSSSGFFSFMKSEKK